MGCILCRLEPARVSLSPVPCPIPLNLYAVTRSSDTRRRRTLPIPQLQPPPHPLRREAAAHRARGWVPVSRLQQQHPVHPLPTSLRHTVKILPNRLQVVCHRNRADQDTDHHLEVGNRGDHRLSSKPNRVDMGEARRKVSRSSKGGMGSLVGRRQLRLRGGDFSVHLLVEMSAASPR